jgi:nucleotide-binding universal stress UspA family protein
VHQQTGMSALLRTLSFRLRFDRAAGFPWLFYGFLTSFTRLLITLTLERRPHCGVKQDERTSFELLTIDSGNESGLRRRDRVEPNLQPRIQRILVPTDFSPCSGQALRQAVGLARQCHAAITLLHVVDLNLHTPPVGPADPEKLKAELWKEGLDNLGQTVLELAGDQVEVQTLIREGLPSEEIAETARECDLIVIGRSQTRSFWRLFTRQTVKGVLETAPCPVLVVREDDGTT